MEIFLQKYCFYLLLDIITCGTHSCQGGRSGLIVSVGMNLADETRKFSFFECISDLQLQMRTHENRNEIHINI